MALAGGEGMSVPRSKDPSLRRCQRVLLMAHELHKRGYQRLRIMPGLSPSGGAWRVSITPVSNILRTHGAMVADYHRLSARYTSGDENLFFEWQDAREDSARALADKFEQRFPEVLAAAAGRDWAYAGWYVEMLGVAESGALPVAYADWYEPQAPGRLKTTDTTRDLPLPPPGEAAEPAAEDG